MEGHPVGKPTPSPKLDTPKEDGNDEANNACVEIGNMPICVYYCVYNI